MIEVLTALLTLVGCFGVASTREFGPCYAVGLLLLWFLAPLFTAFVGFVYIAGLALCAGGYVIQRMGI